MYGWMCCNQWEKWAQWDDEDNRVAQDSLRSQIEVLRRHRVGVRVGQRQRRQAPARGARPSTTASCRICTGRTRSSTPCPRWPPTLTGERVWDGIQMAGPVQLATAELLVQRTIRRHPRGHRRTGRQRAHPAVREPEEVHPRRQALADQRRVVLPRRLEPEKRCADQHSARRRSPLRARPTTRRSSRARRSSRTTSRRAPSSRRSPRTAGTPTR